MKHTVAPDINNPHWKYVTAAETNVKQRFEDHGHKFKDSMFKKTYDFRPLHYWMWVITHKEEV
jgi:hypothetical protein